MKRRLPNLFNSFRSKRSFILNKIYNDRSTQSTSTDHFDNEKSKLSEGNSTSSVNCSSSVNCLSSVDCTSSMDCTSSVECTNSMSSVNSLNSLSTISPDGDYITWPTSANNNSDVQPNCLDDVPIRLRQKSNNTNPKESRTRRNIKAVSAFMTSEIIPQSIQGYLLRRNSSRSLRSLMNINKEQVQRKDSKDVCIEFGDEDDQVLDYTNHQLKNGKIYSSDYEKRVSQDYMKQIEIIHDFQQCTVVEDMPSTAAFPMETNMKQESNCIANFVLAELMNTEQSYVRELASLVENYMVPFENLENTNTLAPAVRGKSHIIFGNLRGLLEYHNNVFLSELLAAADDVTSICHIFVRERHHLLSLYRPYCQNKSHSESFRKEYVEGKKFFVECQKRAGHPLPLSAYLLKPIQRITKYQLMLKELHRHSAEEFRPDLQAALASMLDLLGQLNADMRQLRISSFNGDISLLGNLRLQAECEVMNFKKKTKRYNKSQKRNIFLFDNAVLLCKKRSQPMPITPEYYEHKVCLPINCLGFSELSKAGSDKFEIWDESKADGFAVFIAEDTARMKWIQKLRRHIASTLEKDPNNDKVPELAVKTDYFDVNVIQRNKRPQSWTSTASTESTSSSRVSCEDGSIDPNGNRSSIASINEECQELERFEKCDAADNNSTHVTSIHIPPLDESNKDISTTNNHMIDTRSISDSGIQSRTGPITISESADCVSTAC